MLVRDIGPAAMASFLRGRLRRLAGPRSPILYLRSATYQEPYTDHEDTGRLVVLQPSRLDPWFSGTPEVYVASVEHGVDGTIGFLPSRVTADLVDGVGDVDALREVLGGMAYDAEREDTAARLEALGRELAEAERAAGPIRRWLKSRDPRQSDAAREWMARSGVTEHDLCAAWHHVSRERRAWLRQVVQSCPR